jgi:hypothetical protein
MKTLIAALIIVGALTTPVRAREISHGAAMMVALALSEKICGVRPSETAVKGGEFFAQTMGLDKAESVMWALRINEMHRQMPEQARTALCPEG